MKQKVNQKTFKIIYEKFAVSFDNINKIECFEDKVNRINKIFLEKYNLLLNTFFIITKTIIYR